MSEVTVTNQDEYVAQNILSDALYEGELNDEVSHEQLHAAIALAIAAACKEAA